MLASAMLGRNTHRLSEEITHKNVPKWITCEASWIDDRCYALTDSTVVEEQLTLSGICLSEKSCIHQVDPTGMSNKLGNKDIFYQIKLSSSLKLQARLTTALPAVTASSDCFSYL